MMMDETAAHRMASGHKRRARGVQPRSTKTASSRAERDRVMARRRKPALARAVGAQVTKPPCRPACDDVGRFVQGAWPVTAMLTNGIQIRVNMSQATSWEGAAASTYYARVAR